MSLQPDTIAIIVTLIAVNVGLFAWLRFDIGKVRERVDSFGERIAGLESKMDLLLQGLRIRIEPKKAD